MARGRRVGYDAELEPLERRVALMHIAEASHGQIAIYIGSDSDQVRHILKRPRVKQFILQATGMITDAVTPIVQAFEEKLKATEEEMFDIETGAARRLDAIGDSGETEIADAIRASIGAASIAGRVLDRCGRKGTVKVETTREYRASQDTVDRIADALETRARSEGDLGHGQVSEVAKRMLEDVRADEVRMRFTSDTDKSGEAHRVAEGDMRLTPESENEDFELVRDEDVA